MSFFNLFNRKSVTVDASQIQLIQGLGSMLTLSLSEIINKTLREVLEDSREELGMSERLTHYTLTCKNTILCSQEDPARLNSTVKSLLDEGLIEGGATIVASIRSDSKA